MIMRETLIAAYLDYINNYLTVAVYAEQNGLTVTQAAALLSLAELVHSTPHPDA